MNTIKTIIIAVACLLYANSLLASGSSVYAYGSSVLGRQAELVAACIILEAGGEGERGMLAVACVIQNRTIKDGMSAYRVVTKAGQFASMRGNEDDLIRKAKDGWPIQYPFAVMLVDKIYKKQLTDITDCAYFFQTNNSKVQRWHGKRTLIVGNHSFFQAKQ